MKYPRVYPCKNCTQLMTWTQCKQQYGRLAAAGMPEPQIKLILPLCRHCVTKVLRKWRECNPPERLQGSTRMKLHPRGADG